MKRKNGIFEKIFREVTPPQTYRSLLTFSMVSSLIGLLTMLSCDTRKVQTQQTKPPTETMEVSIETAVKEASAWMAHEGVEGVGQGKKGKKDCIMVFVSKDTSSFEGIIPKTYKGHPIKLEFSGSIGIQ